MKKLNRKWIVLLGLAGSLTLPGLGAADSLKQQTFKYSQHQTEQYRHGDHRDHNGARPQRHDHNRHHEQARHQRHGHDYDRHGHRGHQRHHNHGQHYGHYHGNRFCQLDHVQHYYGAAYPDTYISGVYVTPSLGLVFDLR